MAQPEHRYIIKFLIGSAVFFFIGTVQGVLQVLPPIRAWLDSIGSPVAGPGHMIDPLAHAHINVVGGVVMLTMGLSYYLFPTITGKPVHSLRLANHSFWWTAVGVSLFYVTLLVFGIWEGNLLLHDPSALPKVHHYYAPVLSVAATIMGMGFWIFVLNILLTVRDTYKAP
jgi:heme/copper-type cytochrome/quinol oxidase subunit 1